jgi:hypothetical protein
MSEIVRVGGDFIREGCRLRGDGRNGIVRADGTIEWRWYRYLRWRLRWRFYDLTGRWV